MSILEKIRSRTGLLVGLVGLALAIFILESLLGSGSTLFGSRDTTVGEIAGYKIDYQLYINKVNEQIAMIMQNNPNANIDDNTRSQISSIVWNQFIQDKVVKPEYRKAGISVSDDELYDLMLVHPHQMVIQQLTDKNTSRIHEVVATPDGNLDLIKLNQWVNGMNADAERFWQNLETGIAESEHRMLLSHGPGTTHYHFTWVGGSGNWSDASHWISDVPPEVTHPLPGGNDTVSIPADSDNDSVVDTITVGGATFHSGTIGANVRIQPAVGITVFGGRLTMNGTLTLIGGGQFTTQVRFNVPTTLDGSGTITFENGGGQIGAGQPMTLGAGLTINTGASGGTFTGNTTSYATVNVNGATLIFDGSKFTNRGNIAFNKGFLRLNAMTWTNLGTLTQNGGTLVLNGTFRQADLGNHIRNGGIVDAEGTLLGNLTLDARTGSWNGGGVLRNGRYTARDGVSFAGDSVFDNYILGSDLNVVGGCSIRNTLTLDGTTLRLNGATARIVTSTGTSPTINILGAGRIELSNGGNLSMFDFASTGQEVLSIGRDIDTRVVAGNASIGGNTSSQRLVLNGPLSTTARGQTLTLSVPKIDVHGEIALVSGSTLGMPTQSGQTFNLFGSASIVTSARTTFRTSRSINNASTNPGRTKSPGTTQLNGGSAASPILYEVAGQDRGPMLAGFIENFAVGVWLHDSSSSYARLVNNHDNSPGAEALYVDALSVPGPGTLDLNGLKVYARAVQNSATIVNGTLVLLPDGGPIAFALPTSGRISAAGETDDWTFFGRKGQTVSIQLNPGTNASSSAPAAINPRLGHGKVTLLSPGGATLGTAQSAGLNAIATLANVTLPADGTYTIRAQASALAPNNTGHYKLTLYNVTAETRPLLLNTLTSGNIETPFASDRWTFSLSAGQQIQFDLLNAANSGLRYTLGGPNGYVPFSNISGDSALITIPPGNTGNYVLSVRGATDETGAYSFMVRDAAITSLALGSTHAGVIPGTGSAQWFKVTLPNPGQLLVTLDDSTSTDRNQLYLRKGAAPTTSVYDYRYSTYDADEQIYVPNATPGDWYILVYGGHVPSPSNFTLKADYSDLRITSITPDRYGVDNTMTMTLTGGGFEPGTTVKLVGGATTINASTTEIDSFTQITATFNLNGAPQRTWDVRVERGALSFTLPAAFKTLPNEPANLEMNLVMPGFPTRTSVATGRVEYANTGNVAMPAPLFIVQSADPEGDQFPILSLDLTRTIETFWSSVLPPGTSHRVMILGSGAVAGVLNPGERMNVPFNYLGEKAPFETTDQTLELEVRCVESSSGGGSGAAAHGSLDAQINWDALRDPLQPPGVSDTIWDEVYTNITAPLDTVQDYASAMVANAQYLGRLGLRIVDIDELWNFEVQKAMGTITAFPTLASSVDAQLPAPGEPLTFSRRFDDGVINRNALGPFGYGWSVPWLATLSRGPNDDIITIHSGSGGQRVFVRDGRGSTPQSPSANYFSAAGDSSKLRRVFSGIYELRDVGGIVTRFRSDGKIDYVQDANGNRTTAGYNGAGKLVSLTHTSGAVINLTYNAAGRISQLSDSLGRSITYTYDAAGNHLMSATGGDGSTVSYTYESGSASVLRRHALLSETSGGTTQNYTYDARGRISSTFVAGGAQPLNLSYSFGRISMTDAVGTGHLFFDHRLRLAKVTNALGHSSRMIYDRNDRLTTVILPDGSQQKYSWCDCGSLLSSTDELGNTTKSTRDPITRKVTSITDAKGNVTRFTHDAFGNQLALIYADGRSEYASNYTASGLPQAFTNRRGKTTSFLYNAPGQVTRRTAPDGTITDYVYDSRGQLTTVTQAGQSITRTFDTAIHGDRLKRITYPDGKFVEYDYDDFGRVIGQRDQNGFTTRYQYEAAGRLLHVRDAAGAALQSYTYDAAGRLSRLDNANGTFTTYGYDAAGNVLSIENWRSAGVLNSKFVYTYDARGRRRSAMTLQGAWTYGYDAAGQLTSATFASTSAIPNQNIQITYDAAGNRTFTSVNGTLHDYVTNSLNQYTRVDGVDWTYDADGNLLSDGPRQYTYDDFSRLVQIQAGADIQQFEYDLMGNRSAAILNGVRTNYLVALDVGGTVLAEYNSSGTVLAQNIFAGSLIGRTAGAGAVNFFDFDIVGSTAGVSNSSGAYVNRYAYDPFGILLLSNETISNPFEFNGELGVRSEMGGLSRMGLRDYSSTHGRFTTIDPLRLAADVNTYRFADNSPLMNADPLGMWSVIFTPVVVKGVLKAEINEKGVLRAEINLLGDLTFSVGVDNWQALAIAAQTGKLPSSQDAGWGSLNSLVLNAGFAYSGVSGFANAFQVAMDPNVNQHFVSAACGLAYQREFGTINRGAAKQLAALEAESGGAGGGTVNEACLDGFPESGDADMGIGDPCDTDSVSLAPRPLDPNDKLPPKGFGPDNRIAIASPIEYTVDFENLGPGSVDENGDPYPVVAAVPAQRVAISDELSDNLDWSTVVFTEFAFGDTIVPVTEGAGALHTAVEAISNGIEFVVQIDAEVDLETGVLSVVLQALDPLTGLPPAPLIGVLPPEDGSGNGMGHFKFSVKALPTVPDGTAIRNIAIIQFDANDVIPTNQIDPLDPTKGTDPARESLVTIDAARPL